MKKRLGLLLLSGVLLGAAPARAEAPAAGALERPVPPWAWIAGATGIVSLTAGVGFAVDFAKTVRQLDEKCPENVCRPQSYTLERMQELRLRWQWGLGLSLTLIPSGVAAIVTAAVTIRDARRAPPTTAVLPVVGPGFSGIMWTGAF